MYAFNLIEITKKAMIFHVNCTTKYLYKMNIGLQKMCKDKGTLYHYFHFYFPTFPIIPILFKSFAILIHLHVYSLYKL